MSYSNLLIQGAAIHVNPVSVVSFNCRSGLRYACTLWGWGEICYPCLWRVFWAQQGECISTCSLCWALNDNYKPKKLLLVFIQKPEVTFWPIIEGWYTTYISFGDSPKFRGAQLPSQAFSLAHSFINSRSSRMRPQQRWEITCIHWLCRIRLGS